VEQNNISISFHHVPVPLTPLLGREQEIQDIYTRLLRPEVRLLTLIGLPGVGKTRLALALTARLQDVFDQGICSISLSPINAPEQLLSTIAHALGLSDLEEHIELTQIKNFLQGKKILLLLDTFEHLLPAAPLLVELLEACPLIKMLVTSRATLHVQGEYEFCVLPLALPNSHQFPKLDSLAQVASIALFIERAEALKPGLTLTERNAMLTARICMQLEGIPLAIELAAARTKLLSLQALSDLLDQGIEVLSGGKQDLPVRQQSLYNTIHWSYMLLSPDEQALFRRLCIFERDFTLEAAAVVAMTPGKLTISILDGVTSLIDKSLLQQREREGETLHLSLLKLMRGYGIARLTEAQELEQCQEAYSAYYVAATKLTEDEDTQHNEKQSSWLEIVELQEENLTYLKKVEDRRKSADVAHAHGTTALFNGKLNKTHNQFEERSVTTAWAAGQDIPARQTISSETDTVSVKEIYPNHPISHALAKKLTAREMEVLRLLATGLSNSQIAKRLILSTFTVNRHAQSIYGKLGVNSRSAATRFAVDHHLL
jgi:predicted ATPase/DNA-binding CsgD family transcriptional regulator